MRVEIAADPGRRNRALIAQGGIDAHIGMLDAIAAVVLGGTSLFGGVVVLSGHFLLSYCFRCCVISSICWGLALSTR